MKLLGPENSKLTEKQFFKNCFIEKNQLILEDVPVSMKAGGIETINKKIIIIIIEEMILI